MTTFLKRSLIGSLIALIVLILIAAARVSPAACIGLVGVIIKVCFIALIVRFIRRVVATKSATYCAGCGMASKVSPCALCQQKVVAS
jgi:hypothetical protein